MLLHFGRCSQSMGERINIQIDQTPLTNIQASMLLSEWDEQVFFQAPIQKSTYIIDIFHLQATEFMQLQ